MKGQAINKMISFGYFLESAELFTDESLNPHALTEKQICDIIHAPIVLELYPLYKPYTSAGSLQ